MTTSATARSATIDLNCDLGEIDTPAGHAHDVALLEVITSANIACGGHAGDEATMARTAQAAKSRGVALGAHPSYPDRANFGRVALSIPSNELEDAIAAQIGALQAVALRNGSKVRHVKPHGALYHAAMTKPEIARLIAGVAWRLDPALILVGQWDLPGLDIWRSMGGDSLVASEAFADRRYEPDGRLRSRTLPGALITDPNAAAQQALDLALGRFPFAPKAGGAPHTPHTICIHSDTPNSLRVALAVRKRVQEAGISLAPLGGT
jgi:UPF0271 protein